MECVVTVKEELEDETYKAEHLGIQLLDHNEASPFADQITNERNELTRFTEGQENSCIKKIKKESHINGSVYGSTTEQESVGQYEHPRRKRKISSRLANILYPNDKTYDYNNEVGSSQGQHHLPTKMTYNGLCNTNNQSSSTNSIDDDDVSVIHVNDQSPLKRGSKPMLQKMLTSPYSGKSPLLSSMLTTPKNPATPTRTESTIEKAMNALTPETSNGLYPNSTSPTILVNPTQNLNPCIVKEKRPLISKTQNQSCSRNLGKRHSDSTISKLLTNNTGIATVSGNNIHVLCSTEMNCKNGTKLDNNTDKETKISKVASNVYDGGQLDKEKLSSKILQNEEVINMWSNMITQKVISEFSKDMNATLNSFVKKAIMDSMLASQLETVETGSQSASNLKNPKDELEKVSSLASSLLNSLAEKVSGCTIPKLSDSLNDKRQGVNIHSIFAENTMVKNSNININQNEQKNLECFTKLQTSPVNKPCTATKVDGVVNRSSENVIKSSDNMIKSSDIMIKSSDNVIKLYDNEIKSSINQIKSPAVNLIQTSANQNDLNKTSTTPMQIVLEPVRGKDGKYLVYSCNVCGKRFQHHGTLSVHQRTHILESGKSDFKCDICGKVCTAKRYLDIHMKTHQRGFPGMLAEKVRCSICAKEFTSEENLIIHMRLHLGEKLYQCDICHTGFTRNSQLSIHMRIHSGEKPYVCNICGKSFRQSNGLSLHLNVHTESKPYTCETCGAGFTRKAHYEKHLRKERGERPFKCNECCKDFTDKYNLTMHQRIHQKDKPYVCDVCGKGFVQISHFKKHMKFHSGEKGLDCPHCPERFEMKKFLKNHLIIAHDETLEMNRIKRNRKYKRDNDLDQDSDTNDEESSWEDESKDSNDTDGPEDSTSYSDMIMHISQEFDDSTKEDLSHNGDEYSDGCIESAVLNPDKSNVKMEPTEFELHSESLRSSLDNNTLLNFDPSIVKDEPEECMEEDFTSMNPSSTSNVNQLSVAESDLNFDSTIIKSEPID